jgi:2-dehydro-3-deoxygluconokinase
MTSAICIGECMVELRPEADGCLRRNFAGDAYNTAVYLKRSAPEIDVAFLSATGADDPFSAAMIESWRGEGVSDRLAFRIPGARPAIYLIETDESGDRRFHYWRGESPARQWFKSVALKGADMFAGADLIYVSGISLAILSEQDRENAIRFLGALPIRVAFDPNIRMALWTSVETAREAFEAMSRIAAIVLPSRQDLQLLYRIDDAAQQMNHMAALTAAEIALTADTDGCLVRAEGNTQALPANPVANVVDTSGAGDSFNGAYLAARLRGQSPRDAAQAGLALAAKVVARPGAIIPAT